MKRTISLMILVLAMIISISQAQPKVAATSHLVFSGVSIDGTLADYVSKMEKAGFKQIHSEDGYAVLRGDYGSYKNCDVVVETLKDKDVVSKIAVLLPARDAWSSLSSDYFSMKETLNQEYGRPSDFVEKFKVATPPDDAAKLHAVKVNSSDFYTTYETPGGSVQLSIEHDKALRCFVQLAYYDKMNSEDL